MILWILIAATDTDTLGTNTADQFKLLLITLTVPIVTSYFLNEKLITPQQVLKTVLYANFAYCSLKVGLIALHLGGIVNIWKLMEQSGFQIQRMFIFGEVERLQTSVDISTPFLLLFVLLSPRLGLALPRYFIPTYIVISFLSNALAFSRFLLVIYALSLFLYVLTLNLEKIVSNAIKISLAGILAVLALGPNNVMQAIESRFFSTDTRYSDEVRTEQIAAMMQEHAQHPYFGKGLGGHSPAYIRDQSHYHSYEVQWAAFLMQFGMVGMVGLLLALILVTAPLLRPPLTRVNGALLALYLFWLLSGFTNPFLISLQSGIIYTLFYLAGKISRKTGP